MLRLADGVGGLSPELAATFARFFHEAAAVAVIEKITVAVVGARDFQRMLDGAPILLGTAGHLAGISDDAIAVVAIRAIELLNAVEVAQAMAVDDDVRFAPDTRDAPSGKINPLKQADRNVEQGDGYDHGILELHVG